MTPCSLARAMMVLRTSGSVASTSLGSPETRRVMSTLICASSGWGRGFSTLPRPAYAWSHRWSIVGAGWSRPGQRRPVSDGRSAAAGLEQAAEDLAYGGATELTCRGGGQHLLDDRLVLTGRPAR